MKGITKRNMRVKRIPEKPLFQWRVPSKSEKGTFHIVDYYKDGYWECSCIGFQTRKVCRHIRITKNSLNGLNYYGEQYKKNN